MKIGSFEEFLKVVYKLLTEKSSVGTWLPQSFLDPKTHIDRNHSDYDRHGCTFYTTWSLGGTSGNCWNDEMSTISPDVEPEDDNTLDQIVEEIAPDCSFMKYKVIRGKVMTRGTTHHRDYYGGSTTEAWKGFNIHDLYLAMKDNKLI